MNASFDSNRLITFFLAPCYVADSAANGEFKALQPTLGTLPNDVIKNLLIHLTREERIPFSCAGKRFRALCLKSTPILKNSSARQNFLLRAMWDSARGSSYNLLAWYRYTLKCPWDASISACAAYNGNLAMLQWLLAQGCPWSGLACAQAAAEGGHLEVLQWVHHNSNCRQTMEVCNGAAREGHLHVLQWARANGCPWHTSTCAAAARGGHLELLQWARANGCPWDPLVCIVAAGTGRFEVLQWARANGCPWHPSVCAAAARGGHLEVLQWARANGCPWDEYTWTIAAERIRPWLRLNGCPGAR